VKNAANNHSAAYAPADPNATLRGNIWAPDPRLSRPDGDITLIMLAQNGIRYSAPCDDPWMSAHLQVNKSIPLWFADYPVNLLGCVDQRQICSPDKAGNPVHCTNLTGKLPLMNDVANKSKARASYSLNLAQIVTSFRFLKNTYEMDIWNIVSGRGAAALNGISHPELPLVPISISKMGLHVNKLPRSLVTEPHPRFPRTNGTKKYPSGLPLAWPWNKPGLWNGLLHLKIGPKQPRGSSKHIM
jgi:hypothetical protein